jgi:hypothetical protein
LPRNAQEHNKNREKGGFGFFVDCFDKTFRNDLFAKSFFVCFELTSLRNTRKRDWTEKVEEKLTSFFCKNIFMVLMNSPYRETPKKALK